MSLPTAVKYFLWSSLCGLLVSCENVALMPRPSVEPEISQQSIRETTLDQQQDTVGTEDRPGRGAELARKRISDEVVGTVQRVDAGKREIHLRTSDARLAVIKYDAATIVYDRDREKQIDTLRNGDLILVKITRNSQGEQFADLIRLSS